MLELVITGAEAPHACRRFIPTGRAVRIGRASYNEVAVPWDVRISREHAEVRIVEGTVEVRRLESARNPVYFRGEPAESFRLAPGEEFSIGNTWFRLAEEAGDASEEFGAPLEEHSYTPDELRGIAFQNAAHWLEMLSELPGLIAGSRSDEEFAGRLVELILRAAPRIEAAAVVQYPTGTPTQTMTPTLMRWDVRGEGSGRFRPSRRLVRAALEKGDSVLHVWSGTGGDESFTLSGGLDWAFCVPFREEACEGWCLYVAGRFGAFGGPAVFSSADLKSELRFIELLARFSGATRQVRMLEQQQASIGQFFSPAVRQTITAFGAKALARPNEADITVLFGDMRGFSRAAEDARHDLHALLDRVSETLGVMTRHIFARKGVVADFQGDAALGFWGWPERSADGPLAACRAALAIQAEFQQAQGGSPPSAFRVGIGIAHGRAIAGKIGTAEQAKVGVFGPVVNLGSRLEGMTRQLRVPIVIDETTAEAVRRHLPRSEGRCRRLGRVRPYGMNTPLVVSELLPPEQSSGTVSDQHIEEYESAVDAVTDGRWEEALARLDRLPVSDRAKDFLMIFIARNDYAPPADWDGVITLPGK